MCNKVVNKEDVKRKFCSLPCADESLETLSSMLSEGKCRMIELIGDILILQRYKHGKWCDFVLWDTTMPFDDSHAHLKSKGVAKAVCERIQENRPPSNDTSVWVLNTYERLTRSGKYRHRKVISRLLESKKENKGGYFNPNNCRVGV